jgi:hypothetical protein
MIVYNKGARVHSTVHALASPYKSCTNDSCPLRVVCEFLMHNRSDMLIEYGQVGTSEILQLQSGCSDAYSWRR